MALRPRTSPGAFGRAAGVAAISGISAIATLLQPRCPVAALLHRPCPGCGMTRALRLLGAGHVGESLRMHPLAVPVLASAALLALASVWATVALGTPVQMHRTALGDSRSASRRWRTSRRSPSGLSAGSASSAARYPWAERSATLHTPASDQLGQHACPRGEQAPCRPSPRSRAPFARLAGPGGPRGLADPQNGPKWGIKRQLAYDLTPILGSREHPSGPEGTPAPRVFAPVRGCPRTGRRRDA